MHFIVGLGNPGGQYAGHRHNIGFMALDAIHDENDFHPWSKKHAALVSEGRLGGEKVLLVKPQTFMNDSGKAVGDALRFYKAEPGDVTVLHDELDLPPGKVKVKTGGGNGGHNGLRSIDAHIGKEYRRVRLGIGHPGHKDRVTGHVLGDFSKADRTWLDPLLEALARNADLIPQGEDAMLMNRLAIQTDSNEPPGAKGSDKAKPKGQSHVRQARQQKAPEASGPMADMLKRLFGKG